MRSNSEGKKLVIAAAGTVLVFLVLIVLVATIGGGLRSFERSKIAIADIDISAEALGIADAGLNVTTSLDNSGDAKSGEVDVLVKAYDADTNLLVASNGSKVGKICGRETKSASTHLKLPKEGSYRLQIVVYEDGKGILRGERKIYGLSRLEPPSVAKISIRELDFFVEAVEVESGRRGKEKEYAIVNTTLYIDNLGKDIGGLRALIKARDNGTRLIADRRWEDLGVLKEGTTSLHYAELRVLNGRDYIFEILIWQSERIIKEGSGMVMLSPFVNRTVVLEAKEKTVEISPKVEISDFIPPGAPVPKPYPTPVPAAPGFETLSAALALFIVFVLLLKKRRRGI
ncbi:hypothetical protein DRN97_08330 [Methanosarcinales archaeon]|mgnify:CR=1 FL=1|nr:MAG: hypothetical protein DRN97_08330 [Methanosarcinales archaeon]